MQPPLSLLQTSASSAQCQLLLGFLIPSVISDHTFQIAQNGHVFKITLENLACCIVSFHLYLNL